MQYASLPLTRRGFFQGLIGAGFVAVAADGGAARAAPLLAPVPHVSFHADVPYLDRTGSDRPFRPRAATAWSAPLDDEALIRLGHIF